MLESGSLAAPPKLPSACTSAARTSEQSPTFSRQILFKRPHHLLQDISFLSQTLILMRTSARPPSGHDKRRLVSTEVSKGGLESVTMRSIVIAFLIWQCSSHRIVSCTQTKSTTPPAGTTHSAIDSKIAHVDRKDSAFVADRNNVAKISRSEIAVGQRPVVDTSLERAPKQANRANDPTGTPVNAAMRDRYREQRGHEVLDVTGENIDSTPLRSCVASRDCDTTLNERCIASDAGLVCDCDQGYVRNKHSKTCDSAEGANPIAAEYENAWQQHKRHVARDAIELDAASLRAERESWLLAELQKIRQEIPQESVPEELTHSDEGLSGDYQDLPEATIATSERPETFTAATTEHPTTEAPYTSAGLKDPSQEEHEVSMVERTVVSVPDKSLSAVDTPEIVVSKSKEQSLPLMDLSNVPKLDDLKTSTGDSTETVSVTDSESSPNETTRAMVPEEAAVADGESVRTAFSTTPEALSVNSPRALIPVELDATKDALQISRPKEPEAEEREFVQVSTSEETEALRKGTDKLPFSTETIDPSEQSTGTSAAEGSEATFVESVTVSTPESSEDARNELSRALVPMETLGPAEKSPKTWESETCGIPDDLFLTCMISERPVKVTHESTLKSTPADPEALPASPTPTDPQSPLEEYLDDPRMDQTEAESENSSARLKSPVDDRKASDDSALERLHY